MTRPFIEDPAPHLIAICYQQVERARIECYRKEDLHNIRYFGYYALKYKTIPISRGIKEVIRIIDVKGAEESYIKKKYPLSYEFIDIEARASFLVGSISTCILKCTYSFN